MKLSRKETRKKRATKIRAKIREASVNRLCVHKTPNHIYAQVLSPDGSTVVVAASTVESSVKADCKGHTGNVQAATVVGKVIAQRAKEKNIETLAFDRSGFKYHGRIRALAEAARENGLQF